MVFLAVKHGCTSFGDYPDRQQNVLELTIQYAKADVLLLALFDLNCVCSSLQSRPSEVCWYSLSITELAEHQEEVLCLVEQC